MASSRLEEQYVVARSIPNVSTSPKLASPAFPPARVLCSCVEYLKWRTGHIGERWGDAKDITPDHFMPQIGDVLLIANHAALVIDVGREYLVVDHSNWSTCEKTVDVFRIDDPKIHGYADPDTIAATTAKKK